MLETPLREQAPARPGLPRPSQALPDPFVFVNITDSEAAKGRGSAKRIVRAHVTRVQHAKSATLSFTQNLQSWTVEPQTHQSQPQRPRKKGQQSGEGSSNPSSEDVAKRRKKRSKPETAERPAGQELFVAANIPQLPSARRNGAGRQDPFWTYPVDYEPYLPAIFAHYIENVAVEIPDLDGPTDRGLLRRVWFPLAMEEASTMYAVLLMAASHYCAVNPSSANVIDLLCLKSRALNEINSALRDPKRATSDAIIGAVMKMAAYEAVFGDSAVFSQHIKGLSLMLKMRGGTGTLGLQGLLERMVLWIDINAAYITGLSPQLGGEIPRFEPDPYHFAGIQ